jgi:MFS family permease
MAAMKLGRYLDVLRTPGVGRLALFALMGRLPFGTLQLSMVLLMRREDYDYGQIGAVVGAEALAIGVTAAFVGRLVDRVGHGPVLLATGTATAIAICAEAAAIFAGLSLPLLVVLAVIQGGTVPPISVSMRTFWAMLVPEERLDTAYAFDAMALEVVFIVGPLMAAGLATAWTPAAGMVLCALLYSGAAAGFAGAPAVRAWRPSERAERSRAGALRSAGMRMLVISGAIAAISFGTLEVALTAFAESEGSRGAVGPLVTVWGLGSIAGGLAYGARTWRTPAARRYPLLLALLALGAVPLPFAGSLLAMGLFLFATGLAIAPLGATEYSLIGALAPEGTTTEAYSWQIVANTIGSAGGALLAGLLVEHASIDWALASASMACGLGLLVALAWRRTLVPAG